MTVVLGLITFAFGVMVGWQIRAIRCEAKHDDPLTEPGGTDHMIVNHRYGSAGPTRRLGDLADANEWVAHAIGEFSAAETIHISISRETVRNPDSPYFGATKVQWSARIEADFGLTEEPNNG